MEVPLIGIIVTLIFSAFFSGMETAFLASNRLKIELDKSKNTLRSRIITLFYKNESHFIAMILLGNNISLVFFGLFSAQLLEPIIQDSWGVTNESIVLLLQTVLSTLLVLVTAEFLPKALVQINPNNFLKFMAYPMFLVYWILYLPTYLVLGLSSLALKILRVDAESNEKIFTKVDLEHYVQDLNERMDEQEELGNEMQILQNALDFDEVKARDCMIPRTDVVAIELNDEIKSVRELFIKTGLSKILVFRETIDNIIGYVHSFEMFKHPNSVKEILLPISYVPEAIAGQDLLKMFTEKKSGNIAVVVDEYGGTAGIVTIEDVIEEIFGDIEDEHDREDLLEEVVSENEWLFSARSDIDHLNFKYDFDLPRDEAYETLGGLIINQIEDIPEKGTQIEIGELTFLIEEVSDHRIEKIRIKKD